jgi:hypothetical protein
MSQGGVSGPYLGLRKDAGLVPSQLYDDLKQEADQAGVEGNC